MRKITLILCLWIASPSIEAATVRIDIARFSSGDLDGWQPKVFESLTKYTLVNESHKKVLQAKSHNSASGLVRNVSINPTKTPYIHWSWKTAQVFDGLHEQTKKGDDYPARIYVVFSSGPFFWQTKAINYVWSSNQAIGTIWSNAYTKNARMIAIESGKQRVGTWVSETRNVRNDFIKLFHEEPGRIQAIAIMTDTDNSGTSASTWYGDIWSSSEESIPDSSR